MYDYPRESKKIAAIIKRYERTLREEQTKWGEISDGFGKRYLLGTLYLLLGDIFGAMKSFEWFKQKFPDDSGEPFNSLSWTLALYRSGKLEEASKKLKQTMLLNLYLIPRLIGEDQPVLDIWHGSNWAEKTYLHDVSSDVFRLWDRGALDWLQGIYSNPEFQTVRERYIEIHRQLKYEQVGPKRTMLVNEAMRLRHEDL